MSADATPSMLERNAAASETLSKQIRSRYFAGDRQAMIKALQQLGDPRFVTVRLKREAKP